MKKGPYKILSSRQVYKNDWIEVTEDSVERQDKSRGIFATIDYGSGVTVAAMDKQSNLYLIREYNYVLNVFSLKMPTGGFEGDGSYLDAAKRELKEESGITAGKWTGLGMFDPLTKVIKSPMHLFLAEDLEFGERTTDDIDEADIELVKLPFEEVFQMVMDSRITHGATVVLVLKLKILMGQKSI